MKMYSGVLVGLFALALGQAALAQDTVVEDTRTPQERRRDELVVEKEIAEAQQAIRAAEGSVVPSSGIAGTTTAGAGAGEAEVLALGALQFDRAAREIKSQLRKPAGSPLLIAVGTLRPDVSAYTLFKIRQETLLRDLVNARPLANQISSEKSATPALMIGGAILSYFRSNFSVTGVKIEGLDDAALVAAMVANGEQLIRPLEQNAVPAAAIDEVRRALDALSMARRELEPARSECIRIRAELEADQAEAEAKDRPRIRARASSLVDKCSTLDAVLAAYSTFVSDHAATGGAAIGAVLKQAHLSAVLGQSDLLLVKVHDTAGSSYTQQNFFSTVIGQMPFHVTAASVISWQLLGPDGQVKDAGWQPMYEGYRQVGEVPIVLNGCTDRQRREAPRRCPPAAVNPAPWWTPTT